MAWQDQWLTKTTKREIPDEDVWPNITVFNRKLYTFGELKEAYIKFSFIEDSIQSYDELAYLDTNSCIYRVSEDDYIVVLTKNAETPKIAVIGQLGERYLETNGIKKYNVAIRDIKDYEIIPLSEIYDSKELTYELLLECASSRVAKRFDDFVNHIRAGCVPSSAT